METLLDQKNVLINMKVREVKMTLLMKWLLIVFSIVTLYTPNSSPYGLKAGMWREEIHKDAKVSMTEAGRVCFRTKDGKTIIFSGIYKVIGKTARDNI